MANLPNPEIQLLEDSPEVKSFVYQQMLDFEPFVTPETMVAVIAKDPKKLALQYEAEGKEYDMSDLKSHYRISITLSEAGTKIGAEGVDKDIFIAITKAKNNLVKKLVEIQDNVISQQERNMHIHQALQNPTVH